MIQPGFFDLQDRLHKIDKNGDPLAKINETVNWELFRPALEKARDKGRQSTVGPKVILPVVEGHPVKRVYSLTEVFDETGNKIKQDQTAAFPAVQNRITGPCRKGWRTDSSQAIGAS